MKYKKSVLLLLSIVVVLAFISLVAILIRMNLRSEQEITAEQIIYSYMQANGIEIKPGTTEYRMFMRQIFWGEHPELAETGTNFIKNQEELEYVRAYAWKYSGYEGLYGGKNEPDVGEAPSPPTEPTK